MWNADVTQPVGFGVFDPQGSNYNAAGFGLTPQFSAGTFDPPASVTQPTPIAQQTGGYQALPSFLPSNIGGSASVAPTGGSNQPMTQADCAWYDFACKYQNFQMPSFQSVTQGMMNGPGGAPDSGSSILSSITDISQSDVEKYFVRAVVIILGFIFVAAGLYMFKPNLVERIIP